MEVNMASFYKMDMMNTTRHLAILKVWPLDNTRPGNMLATHALTSTWPYWMKTEVGPRVLASPPSASDASSSLTTSVLNVH